METKENLIIFDIDGCLANSDDFVLTKKEAYYKEISSNNAPSNLVKPKASEENEFDIMYFRRHHDEIKPYYGVFELFVKMSKITQVAIVTSRYEILKPETIRWLKSNVENLYGYSTWRQMSYQMYFNENKESSLTFKRKTISELMKKYNILLLIEDHPKVIDWAKSNSIETLVPATGYKNLNDKDLN